MDDPSEWFVNNWEPGDPWMYIGCPINQKLCCNENVSQEIIRLKRKGKEEERWGGGERERERERSSSIKIYFCAMEEYYKKLENEFYIIIATYGTSLCLPD